MQYETSIDIATMFGFVKNQNGKVVIANRIFETRLYNYYLSTVEMQSKDIYDKSLLDKNQICDEWALEHGFDLRTVRCSFS